ncbi:hypothetical protein D3C71_2201580 [compost metagenome]
MCCRMKDNMWLMATEYVHHPTAVLYIRDYGNNIQIRKLLTKLHFNHINAVLSVSKQH